MLLLNLYLIFLSMHFIKCKFLQTNSILAEDFQKLDTKSKVKIVAIPAIGFGMENTNLTSGTKYCLKDTNGYYLKYDENSYNYTLNAIGLTRDSNDANCFISGYYQFILNNYTNGIALESAWNRYRISVYDNQILLRFVNTLAELISRENGLTSIYFPSYNYYTSTTFDSDSTTNLSYNVPTNDSSEAAQYTFIPVTQIGDTNVTTNTPYCLKDNQGYYLKYDGNYNESFGGFGLTRDLNGSGCFNDTSYQFVFVLQMRENIAVLLKNINTDSYLSNLGGSQNLLQLNTAYYIQLFKRENGMLSIYFNLNWYTSNTFNFDSNKGLYYNVPTTNINNAAQYTFIPVNEPEPEEPDNSNSSVDLRISTFNTIIISIIIVIFILTC